MTGFNQRLCVWVGVGVGVIIVPLYSHVYLKPISTGILEDLLAIQQMHSDIVKLDNAVVAPWDGFCWDTEVSE